MPEVPRKGLDEMITTLGKGLVVYLGLVGLALPDAVGSTHDIVVRCVVIGAVWMAVVAMMAKAFP